jgi:hypothetical protein
MNRGSIVLAGAGVLCLGTTVSAADADEGYCKRLGSTP